MDEKKETQRFEYNIPNEFARFQDLTNICLILKFVVLSISI